MAGPSVYRFDVSRARAPLTTRRLFLRPPDAADIPAITRLLRDRRIALNSARIADPYPAIEGWRFIRADAAIRAAMGRAANFIITPRANPRRIAGVASFQCGHGADPELGYWIAAGERRRGLATEVTRAMLARIFAVSDVERVRASCLPSNLASRRVLMRAGFRRCGVGLRFSRALGRYRQVICFVIDRHDWLARAR